MPLLISCQRLLLSGCPCACVSIRACLIILQKFANTISDQLLVRISPNVQINCSWGQRWNHRRSQDFVWGVHFFLPKKLTTFFSRQRPSKYTSKSNPPRKNCPKNWLLLWLGGCTSCPGGALTHFPCKLCPKNFFSPPWGVQVHPLLPPCYAYGLNCWDVEVKSLLTSTSTKGQRSRPQRDYVWWESDFWNFEGYGFKLYGHGQLFRRRHTDRWFTIKDRLVDFERIRRRSRRNVGIPMTFICVAVLLALLSALRLH